MLYQLAGGSIDNNKGTLVSSLVEKVNRIWTYCTSDLREVEEMYYNRFQ